MSAVFAKIVMRGRDPRIHLLEKDGLPGRLIQGTRFALLPGNDDTA
jgi:hypothetical protein